MTESKPRQFREDQATYVSNVFESGKDSCSVVVNDFADGVWQVYRGVPTGTLVNFLYGLQHNELHRVPEEIIERARKIQGEENE